MVCAVEACSCGPELMCVMCVMCVIGGVEKNTNGVCCHGAEQLVTVGEV